MSANNINPTNDDVLSLSDKLAQFDESLTPAERSIFRTTILESIIARGDVEGHRMEQRWVAGPDGMFCSWVSVDEDSVTAADATRWTTMPSSQTETNVSNRNLGWVGGLATEE